MFGRATALELQVAENKGEKLEPQNAPEGACFPAALMLAKGTQKRLDTGRSGGPRKSLGIQVLGARAAGQRLKSRREKKLEKTRISLARGPKFW